MHGIDISNNNGAVDWRQVATRERFAVLKVSEGAGPHGFIDSTYPANRAGANSEGITIGGYAFATPGPTAIEQADFYLAHAKPRPGDLWAGALDMEAAMPPDIPFALAWCDHVVSKVGGRAVLYGSKSAIDQAAARHPQAYNQLLARHGLWIAAWGDTPPTRYIVWQYRGGPAGSVPGGTCPGVTGFCDLDVWNPHVSPGAFVVPHPSRPWSITVTAGPDDGLVIARAKTIVAANAKRRAWQIRHPRRWSHISRLRYDRPV